MFWKFIQYLAYFWTYFDPSRMQLVKFSSIKMAKYWKINEPPGHTAPRIYKVLKLFKFLLIMRCVGGTCSVWPDWAKFRNFGNILKALVNFVKVCLVFGKILRLLWQISYWAIGIVSIFGEISPLWQHFKSLWHLYMSLFCIEENFETYLAICL